MNHNAEHVGVVQHSGMSGLPRAASVRGFPGKVCGARKDPVLIRGIDRQGYNGAQIAIRFRRDSLPGLAGVLAAVDAIERTRQKNSRITLP